MKEGQTIAFIYGGKLMTGILWEIGLLDFMVKSPEVKGLFYIRHEQVITNGVTEDALNHLKTTV